MAHLTIDVSPELAQQLHEEAARRELGVSEYVRMALEAFVRPQHAMQRDDITPPTENRHEQMSPMTVGDEILAMVDAIWGEVPDEELAKLPPDLSANLDHYLYGTPKRTCRQCGSVASWKC